MTELTEISGIGPSYANSLEDEGYDTAEAVADADPDDLDDVVGTKSGESIVEAAVNVVGVDNDVEDDLYELEPDISVDQRNYLLKSLVQQETKARRVNNQDKVDRLKDVIQQVIDGEPYTLSENQIADVYEATNQMEQELLRDRNIHSFVSTVREVNDFFKAKRMDLRDRE